MKKVVLPYVQTLTEQTGKQRCYFRRKGFDRVSLPGKPGSPEFMEAYFKASGLSPHGVTRFRGGTAPSGSMIQLLDRYADRPGASEVLMKRLKTLLSFAVDRGWIAANPATRIKSIRKSEGFAPWSEEDVAKFEAHWPSGSKPRLALALLLYTGQRRSDVVGMGHQHVRGDLLHVVQQKTKARLSIPLHPVLKAEIDLLPPGDLTFLLTEQGKPLGSPASETGLANVRDRRG